MAKIRNKLTQTIEWNDINRREVFIDYLVKQNNWKIGIEVGVRFGRTLFHLLDNNPDLKMYAVDKDISQFYDNETKQKYKNRLVVLEGRSWDQAELIKEQCDFVFIDAGHSTKSVKKDIAAYKKCLRSKAGLLGHDIDFPAIQRALYEMEIDFDVGPANIWKAKI